MTRPGREGALRAYLLQVARLPRLSPGQRARLAAEAAGGDRLALQALAQAYLPLVLALAAQRRGEGVRFDRLIAAGNQALLQALRAGGEAGLQPRLEAALEHAVAGAARRRA